MRTVAFIPARTTSRRLPGKNLKTVGGVSLVERACEVALQAKRIGVVDEVVVSVEDGVTEKEAIATGAFAHWRSHGYREPETTVLEVLREFLWRGTTDQDQGICRYRCPHGAADLVCLLLPTSPLRTLGHVVASRLQLRDDIDAVMSVTPFVQDVDYALHVEDGAVTRHEARCPHGAAWEGHRYWKHDGTVIWARASWLSDRTVKTLYDGRIVPFGVPREESCDVDTELDLAWAEFLLARRAKQ